MDINDVRSAVTLLGFVGFIALVRWAWASTRRGAFEAAAQLPLAGDVETQHE